MRRCEHHHMSGSMLGAEQLKGKSHRNGEIAKINALDLVCR